MARIGLLSDSHGRAAITGQAVALLLEHGAKALIHLGDVETPEVIDALVASMPLGAGEAEAQVEAHLVFGNVDVQVAALGRYATDLGVVVDHPVGRLSVDGGELVFCHGHQQRPMREAVERGARYLCHGHTHEARDAREGDTRIINPGALHRARRHTVALLCTESDVLTFYSVPSG